MTKWSPHKSSQWRAPQPWLYRLPVLLLTLGSAMLLLQMLSLPHSSTLRRERTVGLVDTLTADWEVSEADLLHLSLLHESCVTDANAVLSWQYGSPGHQGPNGVASNPHEVIHENDPDLLQKLRQCPEVDIFLPIGLHGNGYCEDAVAYAKYLKSRLLPLWALEVKLFDPEVGHEVDYFDLCPTTPMIFFQHYWDGVPASPNWPENKPVYLMPNIEMVELTPEHYWRVDVVLCKTKVCYDRVTQWYKQEGNPRNVQVFHTKHTSSDQAHFARKRLGEDAIAPKDFSHVTFVHTAGTSIWKGTKELLDCWTSTPGLPPLDLYMNEGSYNYLMQGAYGKWVWWYSRSTLYAVRCHGASSTDTTLSACDFASENLYIVNASAAPGALFPAGYVECVNATGNDVELCAVCSCREKKVESVAGVTVAWVVCAGPGDATTCASSAGSQQEFCGSRSSSCSQDNSSSCAGFSANVGESSSSSTSSEVGITSGSAASAGVGPASRSSSSSTDTGVDVGSSSSFDTISSSVGSSLEEDTTLTPSPTSVESLTLSPEETKSQATNEDNVITNTAGTVAPSQTSAATASQANIIRPSDNGSTHELDTNTGTKASSGWSGKRLTVIVSVMCGIAAVAAIAVFVAVRNDRLRKKKTLGTPSGMFTDDGSSVATPMDSRLDPRYRHHGHGRRYGGCNSSFDLSDNTPLAAIVVLDIDDDFNTPPTYASRNRSQSREAQARKLSTRYVRSESVKAGEGNVRLDNAHSSDAAAIPPAPQLFNASLGPSASELPSPSLNPIFDTSNTQVSFSSSMSSEYDSPPSPRVYESEDIAADSIRLVSATYSDSIRDSDASTIPKERYTTNDIVEEGEDALNTIVSFASSLSSLDSTEYELRSTEASEHLHASELPSRSKLSFDVGSNY
ncbi:Homebox domain-containing protein [Phytophthora cinnamomi]|uniref:Homebox domain-containing protein n=1 Tax=Phytophthora cinnamomi TaxID=4785 RepID=UPI003559C3DA|nr:Homebox domain-containing protein [Phytophthora cinnamomi]